MEEEIWVDIEGHEGSYQISNSGRVKSLDRIILYSTGVNRKSKGRFLKLRKMKLGYVYITASKSNFGKILTVHRLVAIHFIPNPENKPEVNHKDGNKENNHWSNLEWSTSSENKTHAFKTGLNTGPRGEKQGNSKLTEAQILEIIESSDRQKLIAERYNTTQSNISQIKSRKRWGHI